VAFTKIQTLTSLQYCPNLRELSLIETGALHSLAGIESTARSLEVLRVIGCQLPAIEPCVGSLTHLRDLILSNNAIEKIENLGGC
jgi:Leucine-rich repeat (LRR) protein